MRSIRTAAAATVGRALRRLGYDLVPTMSDRLLPADVAADDCSVLERVAGYTMTSVERQLALIQATRYITRRSVSGCFVECGVWRGGSSMAAALTLLQQSDVDRDLYLYDTFAGMTAPTQADREADGTPAAELLAADADGTYRCKAGMAEVRANMASTGYPSNRVHLVEGPVEETIPARSPPGPIALLRLDTDWYESTRHELAHLFPALAPGGVLIVDDYGHWQGARRAVDEYFEALPQVYYFHRVDYTARLIVKL